MSNDTIIPVQVKQSKAKIILKKLICGCYKEERDNGNVEKVKSAALTEANNELKVLAQLSQNSIHKVTDVGAQAVKEFIDNADMDPTLKEILKHGVDAGATMVKSFADKGINKAESGIEKVLTSFANKAIQTFDEGCIAVNSSENGTAVTGIINSTTTTIVGDTIVHVDAA